MNTQNVTFEDVNWNHIWRTHQSRKNRNGPRDIAHWDARAKEFVHAATKGDYVEQFLLMCDARLNETVLDIGAAAGTLAVPLAARAATITALEPSSMMRALLRERCATEGVNNVRIVNGRWEDDWGTLGVKRHDVVIASRSLLVDDLKTAIDKLRSFAKRRVYLSTLVGDGPFDRELLAAVGRKFTPGVDYVVVYNYLRQQGIFANISFTVHRADRLFHDLDAVEKSLEWMVRDISEIERQRLRAYLEHTAIQENGCWKLPRKHAVRWAVIWWDQEVACD